MKKLLFFLIFFSILFQVTAQEDSAINILDKQTFKSAIKINPLQLIDVRTSEEYHAGHIANAVNMDFLNTQYFIKSVKNLDKEQPVYLYCHSGNRSRKAAELLVTFGFKKIYDLEGGYIDWN